MNGINLRLTLTLIKVNDWFLATKQSLNVGKTKFLLFHKSGKKYKIPSRLPTSKINNHDIERINTMKFFRALLDDNLSWKEQVQYPENKIAKNIGLLYRTKPFLEKKSFVSIVLLLYPLISKLCEFSLG